jgi:hypothetical protein
MLGVQRPSLNKVLKDLERQGLIRICYAAIEILDPAGLARRARLRPAGSATGQLPAGHPPLMAGWASVVPASGCGVNRGRAL